MSVKRKTVTCAVSVIIAIMGLKYAGEIRTSANGLALIGNAESCRRDPYVCPAGKLTAGIGSTSSVSRHHLYNDEEIARMWVADVSAAERCVNQNFNGRNMNQNQFDALTSAAFNMGCINLMWFTDRQSGKRQRTSLWRYAQVQQWRDMCGHLRDFVYGGGVKLPGLVSRRDAEAKLCLTPEEK
ncbi:lysozyme [Pantoea ananatis]|uniref:lysozyme n=1 Tax=Pantoea ananas TaxID=553 RepID=UPI001B30C8C3|nr:lysozyme [Pantoea ananatis]